MRKPIGITAPWREVGFKTLEQQVEELKARVTKLEKLYEENRPVQTKTQSREGGTTDATASVQRS